MRVGRVGTAVVAMVLACGVAACGDDGGDDVGLEDVEQDDETTTTTTSAGSDDSTTTTAGGEDPGLFDDPDCQQLFDLANGLQEAVSAEGDAPALFDFGAFAQAVSALVDGAPPDIAGDLQILVDAYTEADAAFGGEPVNFRDPAVFQSEGFMALSERLSGPEAEAANESLNDYVEDTCGEFPGDSGE